MRYLFLITAFILLHFAAFADGYWLELKGSGKAGDTVTVTIRYGGVNDDGQRYIKTGKDLDKLSGFRVQVISNGHTSNVSLKQLQDCWQGIYVPVTKGTYQIVAIHDQLPVVQRPDSLQNIRPIQYLSATYNVGTAVGKLVPQQFLDILTTQKDSVVIITPYINKQLVKNTKLRIFNPDNEDIFPLTDKDGKASFKPVKKGLYIIRLDMVDKTPGKNYYSVRHRCDYSLVL
jgi:hypothetical protein